MDGRHYKNPPKLSYAAPKTRVIWHEPVSDYHEQRFGTEEDAEAYAETLRERGLRPLVCSH